MISARSRSFLGHADIKTTMVYTHLLNRSGSRRHAETRRRALKAPSDWIARISAAHFAAISPLSGGRRAATVGTYDSDSSLG